MFIAIIPFLFAVVGLLVYALATNAKLTEAARLTFLAAMISLMLTLATHTVHVGG